MLIQILNTNTFLFITEARGGAMEYALMDGVLSVSLALVGENYATAQEWFAQFLHLPRMGSFRKKDIGEGAIATLVSVEWQVL